MPVSLLMGWALLALLVLLVIGLIVVTLISGRSASPARNLQSPGQEPVVNVFQRGMPALAGGLPVPEYQPAHAGQPNPGGPWAAPQPGGPPGPRRWYPGLGAAQPPLDEADRSGS